MTWQLRMHCHVLLIGLLLFARSLRGDESLDIVPCKPPQRVVSLMFNSPADYFNLREVEAYNELGRNVLLGVNVTSFAPQSEHPQTCNDGFISDSTSFECHSQSTSHAYLDFTLNAPEEIRFIVIYNRGELCCIHRALGSQLSMRNEFNEVVFNYTIKPPALVIFNISATNCTAKERHAPSGSRTRSEKTPSRSALVSLSSGTWSLSLSSSMRRMNLHSLTVDGDITSTVAESPSQLSASPSSTTTRPAPQNSPRRPLSSVTHSGSVRSMRDPANPVVAPILLPPGVAISNGVSIALTSVVSPAAAARASSVARVAALWQCRFLPDDVQPSPLQFIYTGPGLRFLASSDAYAAAVGAVLSTTIGVFLLAGATLVLVHKSNLAIRDGPRAPEWLRGLAVAMRLLFAASVSFLSPNVIALGTLLAVHAHGADRGIGVVTAGLNATLVCGIFTMIWRPMVPVTRLSLRVLRRFVDGCRDESSPIVRVCGAEEMLLAALVAAIAGLRPVNFIGCLTVSVSLLCVALGHTVYIVAVRPHDSTASFVVAAVASWVNNFLFAFLLVAQIRPGRFDAPIEAMIMVASAWFYLQLVVVGGIEAKQWWTRQHKSMPEVTDPAKDTGLTETGALEGRLMVPSGPSFLPSSSTPSRRLSNPLL